MNCMGLSEWRDWAEEKDAYYLAWATSTDGNQLARPTAAWKATNRLMLQSLQMDSTYVLKRVRLTFKPMHIQLLGSISQNGLIGLL